MSISAADKDVEFRDYTALLSELRSEAEVEPTKVRAKVRWLHESLARDIHYLKERSVGIDDHHPEPDSPQWHYLHRALRNSYFIEGIALYTLSHFREAILLLNQARDIRVPASEEDWELYSYLARTYDRLGDYSRSLDALRVAYERCRLSSNLNSVATIHSQIGTVYLHQEKHDLAITHYEEAMSLFKRLQNNVQLARMHNNIGVLFRKTGRYPEAVFNLERSLKLHDDIGDYPGKAYPLYHLGVIYLDQKELLTAKEFFLEGLELARNSTDKYILCSHIEGLGNVELMDAHFQSALEFFKECLAISEESGSKESLYEAHRNLSRCYKALRRFEESLTHFEAFHRIEEEVFNAKSDERLSQLQVMFEVEAKERETKIFREKNRELAELNQKLESANYLKTELLSLAAHDLKNPLQSITGFADLIIEKNDADSDEAKMASAIQRNAARMLKIISDLLQVTYAESGSLVLSKNLLDVAEIAFEVVQENRVIAARKEQEIQFTAKGPSLALADEQRVREILDNLISNAVKYSHFRSSICCTVECLTSEASAALPPYIENGETAPASIMITVSDNGQGFSKEELHQLYGKFKRLSSLPTGGETSTGLGLAIVKQFAELHNGRVWASSAGKNKGATFYVTLPAFVDNGHA